MMRSGSAPPVQSCAGRRLWRFLPLLLLLVALAAVWTSGLADNLGWVSLARNQASLTAWTARHALLAPCLYVTIYVITVALSLPYATVLTAAGGLLFGAVWGGILAIIGATIGASILFLIVGSAFGIPFRRRDNTMLNAVQTALRRDGFGYLLAIRLVPLFPFWLVNLASALCGMRLLPYAAATLIGISPATFIITFLGAGIGAVLAEGRTPSFSVLLSWPVLAPLIALAILALLPSVWRIVKQRHG